MELPDNRFIRYQTAANIRRFSHGVRHFLTKLKIHQHVQNCPPLILTLCEMCPAITSILHKKDTSVRTYLREYNLSAISSTLCTVYN